MHILYHLKNCQLKLSFKDYKSSTEIKHILSKYSNNSYYLSSEFINNKNYFIEYRDQDNFLINKEYKGLELNDVIKLFNINEVKIEYQRDNKDKSYLNF